MASQRDYWIETYKITPPIGGRFGHGAKVNIVEIDARGRRETTLPEHWGQTEAEARIKAKAAFDAWLTERSSPDRG